MHNVTFGSLTSKSVHQINFEDFDINKDGQITQEELDNVLSENKLDLLDLSSIDKDADQKVTKEEYELWQQESEMKEIFDKFKEQVLHDMIGRDSNEIKNLMDKLNDFKASFEKNYIINNNSIFGMSKAFKSQLPIIYKELRNDSILNSKENIKNRVIENILFEIADSKTQGNRAFLGLTNNDTNTLSDNAKRILTNILGKEADKFIKLYSGEKPEEALHKHLMDFLLQSDKDKLADAINLWENSKNNLDKLSTDVAFKQLKDSAKNFLILALEQGITPAVGNITVRTEVAITPALAQFKDAESLRSAIDKIIKELSNLSKLEEIKQKDSEQTQTSPENIFNINQEEENINFFE